MELNMIRRCVAVCETIQDEFDERPIDSSFVLPDYCPDVAAVLKCTLQPSILSRQISGDRLIADGQTMIRVLYLDEGRTCVRCCEFCVPFTGTFTLKEPGTECETAVTVKPDYVNCRATSPRRLDIHGTVTVRLVRTGTVSKELVSEFAGGTVCCRTETLSWTVPAACTEKNFTVNEVLELGENHLPAQALIRSEVTAVAGESRAMTGKVILKGELRVKNLYVTDTETGAVDCVRHVIPFSQIVDLPGIEEDSMLDVTLEPVTSEIHITASQNGEGTLLSISVKVTACLCGYRTESCTAVTDAYSTVFPLILEKQPVNATSLTGIRETVNTVHESVALPPDGVQKILDIWCQAVPDAVRSEEGRTYIDGHITLCMLACDQEGNVGYFERTVDMTLEFEGVCDKTVPSFKVLDAEYQIGADSQLELKVRLCVKRLCYKCVPCLCVTQAQADEAGAYPPQKAALKIYYASKGETLWEIARSCHTDMGRICAENGIAGEVLAEDTMLLIPYC